MLFGIYFFNTLNTLKVNGPIYKQLVEGKDLVADILPPPNYIIETYLTAYELRKLAESSGSQAKTVSNTLKKINDSMAEQSAGSKEILSAIDLLNGISVNVRDGSAEMLIGSREVIQESASLGKITANINESMKSMTAKSGDIERVVTRVNAIGDETRTSIETLIGEIGKFKVHE